MSNHLFAATTFAINHIANILKAVLPVNNHVLVSIDNEGIRFTTEYSHICRIDLTLEKALFTTYTYDPPHPDNTQPVTFVIDLVAIVESLSLAQSNASSNGGGASSVQCTISYETENSPFVMIFEDSKISERCEFATFLKVELSHLLKDENNDDDDDDERDGFEIDSNALTLECIIKSDVFFDALKDLKDLETEDVYFYFANRSRIEDKSLRTFAIVSRSMMGNSLLSLPNEISILEKLKIYETEDGKILDFVLSVFKFSVFQMCFKAIRLSNKCKIQKNYNNLMNLNLLCFRNESGSVLPKSYSGTVINFKIFENVVDTDDQKAIRKFIEKSLKINEAGHTTFGKSVSMMNTNQMQQSIMDDAAIDIPIFL